MLESGIVRSYTDVNGQPRKIIYVGCTHAGRWMKGQGISLIESWILEDGSKVGLPKDAWSILNIKYEDKRS